ncbi:MAG: response regulator [Myxococcales bacterium]|nr:response regulator [Myxococcales bacterium]
MNGPTTSPARRRAKPSIRAFAGDRQASSQPLGYVLLAEDDTELRRLVEWSLEEEGFVVHSAGDGRAMLELLEAAARDEIPLPDVLVMDVRMPQYDGLDVLRALRLSRWDVPVVLMTAFPDDRTLEAAKDLGATCTLSKPVDMDDLVRAVSIVHDLARERELLRSRVGPPF